MMASVSEQLLEALDDLDTDELRRFKWHLKHHKGFSAAALSKADAPDTVDLIMKRFGPKESVKITVESLRKMNQNHVAQELENKHKQAQAEGSIKDPAPVGAKSKPINVTFTNILLKKRKNFLQSTSERKQGEKFTECVHVHPVEGEKKHDRSVTCTNIVLWTRNDFLQYFLHITLDLNTVNKRLRLSERNRAITIAGIDQPYPDHPDRFDVYQVLCRESVCGRCYWEIDWRGSVHISVSYKSISRKGEGDECAFGYNDQSWSLICSTSRYSFRYNNIPIDIPVKPTFRCRRIGVYVDHSAGTLSFYSVSDTMSLIHTVQTTFTQSLYPGFTVGSGSSVKLC